MNKEQLFETSRGKMFIEENRFHNKYSELQIYSRRIPIEYIQEIRITDNYLFKQEYDDLNKNKLIKLCIEKGINIKKA